jgi:hypothetical protein
MDEEDTPETRCEPCFWYGVVGQEPFVIMNLEYSDEERVERSWVDEEVVVTEGPRECIFCRDCAAKVFLKPSRFKIHDIRLYRRIQQASGGSH